MYSLTKTVCRKYRILRILHRKFCAAECAQFFDTIRVEKIRLTTCTSGKLFQFDRVVQWKIISLSLAKKMHLSTLKRCLSSRKSFVNSTRHLKFLQLTWKVYISPSHTRSLFTLACTTYAEPPYRPPRISPMQIIPQS